MKISAPSPFPVQELLHTPEHAAGKPEHGHLGGAAFFAGKTTGSDIRVNGICGSYLKAEWKRLKKVRKAY